MIIRRVREVPNIVLIITPSYELGFRRFKSPRVQNEKIYNYARNDMVTASHVIGDTVMKLSFSLSFHCVSVRTPFTNLSFVIMAGEWTEDQLLCFIEYYQNNFPEDFQSDLEYLEEKIRLMNDEVQNPDPQNTSPSEIKEPYEPSPRMYSSIALTHKLDDMIEIPKSQPKRTYNEDLECEIVMVKMPKCMAWLDHEPIGDLDTMEDKVKNPSPQSTPQVLPSFEVYTPLVTYPEEVKETIGTPMEVKPLDHMKLEDLGLNTNTYDIFLSSKGFPSVDEPKC
ncbi:hypothetical protein Tco_0432331 [Tanacetum coccineum]